MVSVLCAVGAWGQSVRSDELFARGVELYRSGEYRQAVGVFERVAELDEAEMVEGDPRSQYGPIWLGRCYYKLGEEDKAREVSGEYYLFEPVDRRLTVESDALSAQAAEAWEGGDVNGAITFGKRCLEVELKNLGEETSWVLGSYSTLVHFYLMSGEEDAAIDYCNKGLALIARLGVTGTMAEINFVIDRSKCYLNKNDFQNLRQDINLLHDRAERYYKLTGDLYPRSNAYYLESVVALRESKYDVVEEKILAAADDLLSCYKPEEDEIVLSVLDVVYQLRMIARQDKGMPVIDKALALVEKNGNNPVHRGLLLQRKSEISDYSGECVSWCKESIRLLENSEYFENLQAAKCNLASLYGVEGDGNASIAMFKEVVEAYKGDVPYTGNYLVASCALGDIYYNMGYYDDAYGIYKRLLANLEDQKDTPFYLYAFLKSAPSQMQYLNKHASSYAEGVELGKLMSQMLAGKTLNDYLEAGFGMEDITSPLFEMFRVLMQLMAGSPQASGVNFSLLTVESQMENLLYEVLIPNLTIDNITVCQGLAMLAHMKYLNGKLDDAIALQRQTIDIARRKGWVYDNRLYDLAFYQYANGQTNEAIENFEAGYRWVKLEILENYKWMTLDERTQKTNNEIGNILTLVNYAAHTPENRRYAALGYNALLFTKGLLLNSTIELTRLLQEEGDAETLELLARWREMNLRMQQAEQNHEQELATRLTAEAKAMEKRLLAMSKTYGDYTQGLTVEYPAVQKGLGENDVAVEFMSYQASARARMYGALVLTRDEAPRYVPVGLTSSWSHIDLKEGCYRSTELFDILFKDLKAYMPKKGEGDVYFAAEGVLHTIALEALPGAEGYSLKRLSSTREIALRDEDTPRVEKMALIGGVSYGLGSVASYYPKAEEGGQKRGTDGFLKALPGTKTEVTKINSLLSSHLNASLLTGDKATEEAFKGLSGKHYNLMHIGTHGFFDEDQCDQCENNDPLGTSGLYLAGAQNTLYNMDTEEMVEDGVLTGNEIATLDFRGLQLAVLSACETGRGYINAEGVFGLQRAFKQAGTKSLMISLWKVDDDATQMLMDSFYSAVVAGKNQYEALRSAQGDVKRVYPDPRYWAPFILVDAQNQIKL